MGTKRIGLARVEALIENLKREIDLSTGTLRQQTLPAIVTNGDADLTVTKALHCGKTILQGDVSADRTLTLPTPTAIGETYKIIGFGTGAAADGHDVILDFADDACYFEGAVVHSNTGGNDAVAYGNGTSNDRLTINVPGYFEVTLVAKSLTVMYVTGIVSSAAAPVFSDQD